MDERFITLLFTYPKDFRPVSWVIKTRLKTDYSHVCAVVSTGPIGLFDVYQASHGSVHGLDLCEFLKKNNVIKSCRIRVDKEDYYKIIRYLKKQRGKKYSEAAAVASTFPCLRALGIGRDGDDEFICSEYIVRALEQVDAFNYGEYRDHADYVDPKVFEKVLEDNDFKIYPGLHMPEYKGEC